MLPWFLASTLDAVAAAVSATPAGTIAVVGAPRLARALANQGRSVLALAAPGRALRRAPGAIAAAPEALPLADASVAAAIGPGLGERDNWTRVLAEWSRAVLADGAIVSIDRAPRAEVSRRALCAGLVEIEQRQSGRYVVTSGRIARL